MGQLSQEQLNVDLFNEVKRLKKEVSNYRSSFVTSFFMVLKVHHR